MQIKAQEEAYVAISFSGEAYDTVSRVLGGLINYTVGVDGTDYSLDGTETDDDGYMVLLVRNINDDLYSDDYGEPVGEPHKLTLKDGCTVVHVY